jgi:sensor domain CHASE-containing protein
MSLRYKSLIVITFFVLILFFIFLIFSHYIFLNFSKKIEERYALENLQRVKNSINKEIYEFDSFSKGFAFFDQSYSFVNLQDHKYIVDNLKESDFNYFNLSFILFTDLNGEKIYSKNYCFKNEDLSNIFFKKLLENQKIKETIKNKSETSGIFGFDGNEFVVSVNPVFDNYKKKPSNGFLVTGRQFDKIGLFKVKLSPNSSAYEVFNSTGNNSVEKSIKSRLIISNQLVDLKNDRTELISYLLVHNISNQPELIIKIIQGSEIFEMSREAIILYASISFIVVFVLISILLIFFERLVISKIIKLNENVGLMTVNKRFNLNNGLNPEKQIFEDEIDYLNKNICKLLSAVSYRNNLENFVIGAFSMYLRLTEENAEDFINEILKKTGSFSGSDLVSVVLFSKGNINSIVSYYWHAQGIDAIPEKFKIIPLKDIEWVYDKIKAEGKFHMESLKDLPENLSKFKRFLVLNKTKSFLSLGMIFDGNLIGMLKLDTVLEEKEWSSEDVELLRNIAMILASTIMRYKSDIIENS